MLPNVHTTAVGVCVEACSLTAGPSDVVLASEANGADVVLPVPRGRQFLHANR
jgi:hypothetical protein